MPLGVLYLYGLLFFFNREPVQFDILLGLLDVDVEAEASYSKDFDERNESLNRHLKSVPQSPAILILSASWLIGNRTSVDSQPCLVGPVPAPPVKLRPSGLDPSISPPSTGNHFFGDKLQCVAASSQVHPAKRRLIEILVPAVHPRVLALRMEARVFNPRRNSPSSHQYLVVPENPAGVAPTSEEVATSGTSDELPSENRDLRGSDGKDLAGGSPMGASDGRNLMSQVSEAIGLSFPVKSESVAPVGTVNDMICSDESEIGLSASVGGNRDGGCGGKLMSVSESESAAEKKFKASNELVTGTSSAIPVVKRDLLAAKGHSCSGSTMLASNCGCNNASPVSEATCGSENEINWPLIPAFAEKCGEPDKFNSANGLSETGNRSNLGSAGWRLPTAVPGRLQSCIVGLSGAVKGEKVRKLPQCDDMAKFPFPVGKAEQVELWLNALCRSPGWFHRGKWALSWKKMMAVQWQWNQLNPSQQNDAAALKHSSYRRRHVASQFSVTLAETQFLLECMKVKKCCGPEWYRNWMSRTLDNIFSPRLSSTKLMEICYAEQKRKCSEQKRKCSDQKRKCSTNVVGRSLLRKLREQCYQRPNGKTFLNIVESMNQQIAARMAEENFFGPSHRLQLCSTSLNIVERMNQAVIDQPIGAWIQNKALLPGHYLLSVNSPPLEARVVPAANVTIRDDPVPDEENPGLNQGPNLDGPQPGVADHPGLLTPVDEMHPALRRCFTEAPNRPYLFRRPRYQHSDDEEASADVAKSQGCAGVSERQSTSMDTRRGPITYGRHRRLCRKRRRCHAEEGECENSTGNKEGNAASLPKVKKEAAGGYMAGGALGVVKKESEDSSDDGNWADMKEYDSA